MEYRNAHSLPPAELTDAVVVCAYTREGGWAVAGFVIDTAGVTALDIAKFAIGADATLADKAIFARRVQATDVKLARRKRLPQPPEPAPEVTLEDLPAPA